jgi:hypothetical protein
MATLPLFVSVGDHHPRRKTAGFSESCATLGVQAGQNTKFSQPSNPRTSPHPPAIQIESWQLYPTTSNDLCRRNFANENRCYHRNARFRPMANGTTLGLLDCPHTARLLQRTSSQRRSRTTGTHTDLRGHTCLIFYQNIGQDVCNCNFLIASELSWKH